MKLNIEVHLDWINEDSNIDSEIKRQVMDRIVSESKKALGQNIIEECKLDIVRKAEETIASEVNKYVKNFLSKKVNVTDSYGDVTKKGVSVNSLIKEKFDKAMMEKVDRDGKPSRYGDTSRRDYLINKAVKNHVDAETRRMDKDIQESVKKYINERLKEGMAKSVRELLELDKLIEGK